MNHALLNAAALALPIAHAAKGPIPAGGFKHCKSANAAGYGDIRKGTPAYHPRLDRDKDGVACEWSKWRK